MPHLANPETADCGFSIVYNLASSLENWPLPIVFICYSLYQSLTSFLHWSFRGLNTSTSSGCNKCEQCGERHSKWTWFFIATSTTSNEMCDMCPSYMSKSDLGEPAVHLMNPCLNQLANRLVSIHPFSEVPYSAPFGPPDIQVLTSKHQKWRIVSARCIC